MDKPRESTSSRASILSQETKEAILAAMTRKALDGNVTAAKIVLEAYREQSASNAPNYTALNEAFEALTSENYH